MGSLELELVITSLQQKDQFLSAKYLNHESPKQQNEIDSVSLWLQVVSNAWLVVRFSLYLLLISVRKTRNHII